MYNVHTFGGFNSPHNHDYKLKFGTDATCKAGRQSFSLFIHAWMVFNHVRPEMSLLSLCSDQSVLCSDNIGFYQTCMKEHANNYEVPYMKTM